jgi:pimeloyl-ACP methyl ester carboxylesterase
MTSRTSPGFLFFPQSRTILRARKELILAIDNFLWHLGSGEMTAQSLGERLGTSASEVGPVLDQYYEAGVLSKRMGKFCPAPDCLIGVIWEDEFGNDNCPNCGAELTDEWRRETPDTHYVIRQEGRAFPPWILLIHGMNTTGDWQQRIAFIQGLMGESSPFFSYKYGIKRIEPFFGVLQKWRTRRFLREYRQARMEAEQHGVTGPPDVIAHSFGTLIIGRALRADPSVKFGRVLLCGSILPPNFEWSQYFREDRALTVLNHFGGKDFWAKIAVRAIPNSGPSGRIGFVESSTCPDRLFNVRYPAYHHSDFFEPRFFETHFKILWRPYFWGRLEELSKTINLHAGLPCWKKPVFCLRAPFLTWLLVLSLFVLLYWMVWGK